MTQVLGLDGTEYQTVIKYNTFCSLCTREIKKEEIGLTWKGRLFFKHLDCSLAIEQGRMTNLFFRENIKKKSNRKNRAVL